MFTLLVSKIAPKQFTNDIYYYYRALKIAGCKWYYCSLAMNSHSNNNNTISSNYKKKPTNL